MNVPSEQQLRVLLDQYQRDHPVGQIAARYVEQALQSHPPPPLPEKIKKPKVAAAEGEGTPGITS
jgi:hypothetical protein